MQVALESIPRVAKLLRSAVAQYNIDSEKGVSLLVSNEPDALRLAVLLVWNAHATSEEALRAHSSSTQLLVSGLLIANAPCPKFSAL